MTLVLVGFMGAGKTTAAGELAAALGGEARDLDTLVEAELGATIAEVFERDGEPAFREAEARVALRELARDDGGVLALGGGTVLDPRVREALARHTVVHVDVAEAEAWVRASGGTSVRPLARDRDAFAARFAERAALYDELADAVLVGVGRGHYGAAAQALVAARPAGTRTLWTAAAGGAYPVLVRGGLLDAPLEPWPAAGRRFAVTDETVGELYAGRLPALSGLVEVPPGEQAKTLQTAEAVWRALVAQGATRADHVVALGGGVVGDLAGFCAATYQRGVPVVQVPTTLVAMVDSAYGGKTGVDLPEAKNYVGAYHQPAAVLVDPALLASLPAAELAAGYAEVVKTALIAGGSLWERVRGGGAVDEDVIVACARTKLSVVAADERDGGRRQVLNLGHTVGHGIETATDYARLRHGEAVGIGLLAALRLSGQDTLRDEVGELLRAVGLPTTIDDLAVDDVLAAMRRDKKRVGEEVPFVVVDAPGTVRHGVTMDGEDVRRAVAEVIA